MSWPHFSPQEPQVEKEWLRGQSGMSLQFYSPTPYPLPGVPGTTHRTK